MNACGSLARAHLGLVVVGGHLARGVDQLALLALLRGLLAAAEEVGHMGILLGLGDMQLAQAAGCQLARQGARRSRGLKRDGIGPPLLVARHRHVVAHRGSAAAVELVEVRVGQRAGQLAHAVGAEIEGDDGVLRPDAALLPDEHRLDELIRLPAGVGVARRLRSAIRAVLGAAVDEQVVGELDPLPALVAVHRVVAPDHRGDAAGARLAHPLLDGLKIARARLG